jgi:hypothetical protein
LVQVRFLPKNINSRRHRWPCSDRVGSKEGLWFAAMERVLAWREVANSPSLP